MSVISRPWSRLTLTGKIVIPLVMILVALTVLLLVGWVTGLLPWLLGAILDTLGANIGIVRFVLAATAVLLITVPTAFVIIFMEMKIIAFVNLRVGPNRTGPWGTLSSVIHGLKVLAKEDYTPTGVDVPVFTLAPAVVYLASVMTLLVMPFAPGLLGFDMDLGLLYFFAMGGLGVVGLMMAGWSSYNKYSLLGGLRAAAAIISYEIPLTLSVVGVIMLAGTLSLNRIVELQAGSFLNWYAVQQPLAFAIFFIAATAEGARTPFDLTEADSEIVAGFATEYSGMRFGFFFFAEYVNVFILSALTAVIFLGGWNAPFDINILLNFLNVPTPFVADLDPGRLGMGLIWVILLVPPILVGGMALGLWAFKSGWSFVKSLVVAFLLFNVLMGALLVIWAAIEFPVVMGLLMFLGKTYTLVALFVLMRGTLPRVRIDQLMGFAWKWLIPASLANIFVTAGAILVVAQLKGP
ncbi:MAG: NADH-quinone oxidoreductase subunit [Chloroflexota bacterium]|jgi:NADH-quinone oxidoreductase subunit H|nr:NADH-quinone oxidoreductase subunit [Chloroflexota bacterium]